MLRVLVAVVLSTGAAGARGEQRSVDARACPSENAVYHVTHHAEGVPPDELRLRFKDVDWEGYASRAFGWAANPPKADHPTDTESR